MKEYAKTMARFKNDLARSKPPAPKPKQQPTQKEKKNDALDTR